MNTPVKLATYHLFLNGKEIKFFTQFNEKEGWVEIPDFASMGKLNQVEKDIKMDLPVPTEVPIKRIYGNVEIRKQEKRT